MGGVGVLGDAAATQPVKNVLGQHDPGSIGIDAVIVAGDGVGEQLVDGVEAMRLRAGALEDLHGRDDDIGGFLGCDGALIAIAERLMQGATVGGESNVVHRPAVDGNGGDALWGGGSGFAQAFFKSGQESIERPAEPAAAMDRTVGDAMDDFDPRFSVVPAEHGDAAAFSA